jgi:predicted hotdog family 3-hydroxylacyl-ACP dehydratase
MSSVPVGAPIGREALRALLPHAGSMCLLESVQRWDASEILCTALSHRASENPLRSGGRLGALAAIEYAAQAIAIHGSLRAPRGAGPRTGFLGRVSQVRLAAPRLDDIDAPLAVSARHLAESSDGCSYDFEVSARGIPLVTGRVLVAFARDAAG